jgi:hypothetical protein
MPISEEHFALLKKDLVANHVQHLPPLLAPSTDPARNNDKNISRAFSAFALRHLTEISIKDACAAVIDDFDDFGVDAIYYHPGNETIYLVQSKLKASEQFSQTEALAFSQGVRRLLSQEGLDGFNANFQNRKQAIVDALDNCSHIQLVIAHTGSGINNHAKIALDDLLRDEKDGDQRLSAIIIDFDFNKVVAGLRNSHAYKAIKETLVIHKYGAVADPKPTHFGRMKLKELVDLHKKHGNALYEKNIRTFLGHKTEVNASIQKTLAEKPDHFFYLNNGITILCRRIEPKSNKSTGGKRVEVTGLSVINGAQTISSSAQFLADTPGANIDSAFVSVTLIQADANDAFGKEVTRARNHQNPVLLANFVALEDEQERLRCELAHLGIQYSYKAEYNDGVITPTKIKADEAVHALALFHPDPRYVLWLKNEPSSLLDTSSSRYKDLITGKTTPFQVVNAIRFARYVNTRMIRESIGTGPEKLTYKHGASTFGWILAKRVLTAQSSAGLFDPVKIEAVLSAPGDALRQTLWDKTRLALDGRTPLVVYRNQTRTLPIVEQVMLENFGLAADQAIPAKRAMPTKLYAEELFNYMISKAPQIGGLI